MNLNTLHREATLRGTFSYSLNYGDLSDRVQESIALGGARARVKFEQCPSQDDIISFVRFHLKSLTEKQDSYVSYWHNESGHYLTLRRFIGGFSEFIPNLKDQANESED